MMSRGKLSAARPSNQRCQGTRRINLVESRLKRLDRREGQISRRRHHVPAGCSSWPAGRHAGNGMIMNGVTWLVLARAAAFQHQSCPGQHVKRRLVTCETQKIHRGAVLHGCHRTDNAINSHQSMQLTSTHTHTHTQTEASRDHDVAPFHSRHNTALPTATALLSQSTTLSLLFYQLV